MKATRSSSDETTSPVGWGCAQTCKPSEAGQELNGQELNRQEAEGGTWDTAPGVRICLERQLENWQRATFRSAPFSRPGWHVICNKAELHCELMVLLMRKKMLSHDPKSWQFSPWGRSATSRGAQTATVPLLREESPADLPWRIPTRAIQDSRQTTWLANYFKVWLFSHSDPLYLLFFFCCLSHAEQKKKKKKNWFLSSRLFTTSQSLWGCRN